MIIISLGDGCSLAVQPPITWTNTHLSFVALQEHSWINVWWLFQGFQFQNTIEIGGILSGLQRVDICY